MQNGAIGVALDTTHLLGAAVWLGALFLLVGDLWRTRGDPPHLVGRARRYSSLAVVPVVVLATAGAVSALVMIPATADLWSSTYGRLLVIKTLLFAAALAIAWRARRRVEPGGLHALRRLTRIEGVLVVGALAVAAVPANTAPPPPRVAVATLLGPPPLSGPMMRDAGLAGILTVALGVGDGRLQVEVLAPGGSAPDIRAEVEVSTDSGAVPVVRRGCTPAAPIPPAARTAWSSSSRTWATRSPSGGSLESRRRVTHG